MWGHCFTRACPDPQMCAVLACAPTLPEGWCRDGASRQGGWTREGLQCSGKNERDWAPGRQPGLFTEGPPEPTGQGYPRTCLWLPETRLWVEGPWAEGVGVGRVQATSSLCRAGWRPQRSPWRTEGACVYVCVSWGHFPVLPALSKPGPVLEHMFLLLENLLINPVILKCKLWEWIW